MLVYGTLISDVFAAIFIFTVQHGSTDSETFPNHRIEEKRWTQLMPSYIRFFCSGIPLPNNNIYLEQAINDSFKIQLKMEIFGW